MRILISYHLKNRPEVQFGHNFPNIEKAWDWFDSMSKDCVLFNGAVVEAKYINAKVHSLEELYQSAVCNEGKGSVVAQSWVDDEEGNKQLADVCVSLVQY